MHVGRHSEVESTLRGLRIPAPLPPASETDAPVAPSPITPTNIPVVVAPITRRNFKQQARALWEKDVRGKTVFCVFIMGIQQVC
jgi:hypothetical protein